MYFVSSVLLMRMNMPVEYRFDLSEVTTIYIQNFLNGTSYFKFFWSVIFCVLLFKNFRSIITEVLGGLQFNFYHQWFDLMFLISALVSIAFLWLAHKQTPEV